MAIVNGYCTLTQAKNFKRITSTDSTDDSVIEEMIEEASRLIDAICNRWFYAYTQTRYFDVPRGRELCLDGDLLAITTLTNGDGTTIASTEYNLQPKNSPPYYAVVLKPGSTTVWQPSTSGGYNEKVISIAGSWGFVDRTASDPVSDRIIKTTRQACLEIFNNLYGQRFGDNTGGQVAVTAAGVVITPYGAIPKAAYQAIAPYARKN